MVPWVNSLLHLNNDLHPPCRANHSQQRIFEDDMVASRKYQLNVQNSHRTFVAFLESYSD